MPQKFAESMKKELMMMKMMMLMQVPEILEVARRMVMTKLEEDKLLPMHQQDYSKYFESIICRYEFNHWKTYPKFLKKKNS